MRCFTRSFGSSRVAVSATSAAAAATASTVIGTSSSSFPLLHQKQTSSSSSNSLSSSSSALLLVPQSHISMAHLNTGPQHWATKAEEEIDRKVADINKKQAEQNKKEGLPLGCLTVTAMNIEREIVREHSVPCLLYFHVTSHPEVVSYTTLLKDQVGKYNREAVAKTGRQEDIALKLGLINCEGAEGARLAQQFRITGAQFPLIFFLVEGNVVDQMVGVGDELVIRDAINQFLSFFEKKKAEAASAPKKGAGHAGIAGNEAKMQGQTSGGSEANPMKTSSTTKTTGADGEKMQRNIDEDEENPTTLLQVAVKKLQEKDFAKCEYLLNKADELALPGAEKFKKEIGVGVKKISKEMIERLRKHPDTMALPQILAARSMMALVQKKYDDAGTFVDKIRRDFSWSCRDSKMVADCVCRVEMIRLVDYDVDRDNYVTLLKRDELIKDPIEFYFNQIRLACCHYFERHPDRCLEELLKVIRMEAKLLPTLRDRGYLEKWSQNTFSSIPEKAARSNTTTLARRIIFLVFEAIGNDQAMVTSARKKLAAYL